jgi:hypothetical protein
MQPRSGEINEVLKHQYKGEILMISDGFAGWKENDLPFVEDNENQE